MPIFAGSLALLAPVGLADYRELAATLALLVGLILVLAGVFRAGWVADLLSIPVVTGFLAGIAIHIAISQAPALLGLPGGEGEVFHRLALIGHDIGKTNFLTLAIGASCLACIVLFEKISPRIPGALIALAGATFVVAHFDLEARGVAVIGAFDFAPPHPAIPMPSLDDLTHVIGLAAIISVIIMVQTAATSRSFPGAPGEAPDVDRDFIGVGAGSALAGLFGAFPVDASPPSTAIVAEVGARSQLAGLVACAVVAAVAVYGAELLAHVPEAALAGVLLYVAGRIFRLPDMLDIGGKSKAEFALVVVTMLGVVILPVQIGVALAIMLSLVHGVWMMTRTRLIEFDRLPGTSVWWPLEADFAGERLFGVLVVAFQAPLSFLNAYQFQHDMRDAIARADGGLRLVVLEASSVVEIDFTAARILQRRHRAMPRAGRRFRARAAGIGARPGGAGEFRRDGDAGQGPAVPQRRRSHAQAGAGGGGDGVDLTPNPMNSNSSGNRLPSLRAHAKQSRSRGRPPDCLSNGGASCASRARARPGTVGTSSFGLEHTFDKIAK